MHLSPISMKTFRRPEYACMNTLGSLFRSVNYSHEVVGVRTAADGDSKKTLCRPTNFARQKFEVARGRRRRRMKRREDDGRNISIRRRWESRVSFPVFSSLYKCRPKTVNPLDPRQQFCQYWLRECNLTADFWICISWHPQISQSESWDHYQPISFWIRWILAPSNQPIIELGPLSTNQLLDPLGLSTSVCLEANPTSRTVKIASPWV